MAQDILFNRLARLRVGELGGEGRDLSGLRVSFSVAKTSESNSNVARISVYNLNPDSRALMETQPLSVILEVGYRQIEANEFLEILAVGDVKRGKVKHERQGADWVTTLEIGDGEIALQEKIYNKAFEPGASLRKIMSDVAGSFGKPVAKIIGLEDKTYNSSQTFSGSSKDVLDNLTKEAGLEWSIQDDEVQILKPDGNTTDEVIVLNSATGLLNSPVKREQGVEFKALINPSIRPGRRVKIESRDLEGVYRVRKATFNGDTHEGSWTVDVEAI